ncbi:MAG: hypothetical protein ACYTG3_08585 [Planctomycetota bacterium]|jgi:hypothetical protein
MEPEGGTPRCANQLHVGMDGAAPEPAPLCACAAGLIHMHDCPVAMGLECVYFRPLEGEPEVTSVTEEEEVRGRLMSGYLSRSYFHRVRSLAPAGDPWNRRREELYAFYATVELGGKSDADPDQEDDRYQRERDRLLIQRRKREEAEKEREERTREDRARDRARLGIKTVVEKAQEAVASQGNVASSVVDDVELPAEPKKRRRRRRRRKPQGGPQGGPPAGEPRADGAAPPPPAQGGEGERAPRRRRGRRRRRRGGKGPAA